MEQKTLLALSTPRKIRLFSLLLIFFIVAGVFWYKAIPINPICLIFPENQDILRVAHAGGGIDGITYTNSIQALNSNYAKGFRYFEIDFNTTSDAVIVCIHDWAGFRRLAKKDDVDAPLRFADFEALNEQIPRYKNCTLESLAEWFGNHKDAFLITDVKDNNLKALEVILDQIPNSKTAVIPQIYAPDEYAWVAAEGVEKVIWTLYRTDLTELQILKELEKMKRVFAVTMSVAKAESNLTVKVLRKGFSVYAHTVNDSEEFKRLSEQNCVSEIYTDFLAPVH